LHAHAPMRRDILLAITINAVSCSSQPAAPSCNDVYGRGSTTLNTVFVSCRTVGSRLQCQAEASIQGLYVYCPRSEDVTLSAVWTAGDSAVVKLVAPGEFESVSVGDTFVHAIWERFDSDNWARTPISVFPGTSPMRTREIAGVVTAAGQTAPIAGAVVQILDGLVAGRTSTTGVPPPLLPGYLGPFERDGYRLMGVPPGRYRLRVTKDGYTPQEADATVTEVAGDRINFALSSR
jgi:hypothetical protein